MKSKYPDYKGKMKLAEKKLNADDKKVLEEYKSSCSSNAGQDKVEQRIRYAIQFRDVLETPFKDFAKKIKGKWDKAKINHLVKLIKEREDREIIGRNEVLKQLKYFLNWLYDDLNLIKDIKLIKQSGGYNTKKINADTLPTTEELKTIIRGAESIKHKAMLMLLSEAGMRPCEVLNLRWRDIKFIEE